MSTVLDIADLCVGTVADGRSRPELSGILGYFINPLAVPLRDVSGGTIVDLLGQAATGVVGAAARPAVRGGSCSPTAAGTPGSRRG
jgi:hypothetical protein